jgi:hypothetical protein
MCPLKDCGRPVKLGQLLPNLALRQTLERFAATQGHLSHGNGPGDTEDKTSELAQRLTKSTSKTDTDSADVLAEITTAELRSSGNPSKFEGVEIDESAETVPLVGFAETCVTNLPAEALIPDLSADAAQIDGFTKTVVTDLSAEALVTNLSGETAVKDLSAETATTSLFAETSAADVCLKVRTQVPHQKIAQQQQQVVGS